MTPPARLLLSVYAPALTRDDGRPLAAVHAMERGLNGLKLEWEVSGEGQLIAVPQRDAWLSEAAARGKFPLLCNGDENYPVTIAGLRRPASPLPGGQPQLQVHADLPLDEVVLAAAASVLEGIAEGAHAFWGHASPEGFGLEVAKQMRHSDGGPAHSFRGLPMLKPPDAIGSPEIPHYLGWLNYWSAATAHAIGFPDAARDAEWMSRAQRTATGGWIVQITETPLDFTNPVHVAALQRAYTCFPAIGGRSSP
ncbi:hypothetical protein D7W81_18140 [Corallococcus aberystwythensis]|uniref:Uncharacterized protein n=2 Tax=Corallococcus aberystwythensis TaxID=2316722 RepID=A0A3A8Q7M2_9BACT|nr:hypothetical protein D7W81_18140 [Corallococcus aberystwythensis]